MNSVNWGGATQSVPFMFRLDYRLPGQAPAWGQVQVQVGAGGARGAEIAWSLTRTWNLNFPDGPRCLLLGPAVHFLCRVMQVTLDPGVANQVIPDNGQAVVVPGNPGLVAWRE